MIRSRESLYSASDCPIETLSLDIIWSFWRRSFLYSCSSYDVMGGESGRLLEFLWNINFSFSNISSSFLRLRARISSLVLISSKLSFEFSSFKIKFYSRSCFSLFCKSAIAVLLKFLLCGIWLSNSVYFKTRA